MRLTSLNPKWLYGGGEGTYHPTGEPIPLYTYGIEFDCPCGCGKRRAIPFKNPVEPGIPGYPKTSYGWKRSGTTFEDLTLEPSIWAKRDELRPENCGWHGWVTKGDVTGSVDLPKGVAPISSAPVRSGGSHHQERRMGRTLDRSRYHATSFGETNRRFYQDGRYFDASGNEVDAEASEPTPEDPPLGAGTRAGVVLPGATSTSVDSSGGPPPPATGAELRAQLEGLVVTQVKKIFLSKGGDPEIAKGPGSKGRMADWLVAQAEGGA